MLQPVEVADRTRTGKPALNYGYLLVAVAFLSMFVVGGAQFSFGVFFKPLSDEFGWNSATTAGAFSIMNIMLGIYCALAGRLNDRFGIRVVLSGAALLLGVAYFLVSRITSLWQLYLLFGTLLPLGVSGGFVPLLSTVARYFSKRRGLMSGIVTAGVGAGMMVIPPVANLLIASSSWRNAYLILSLTITVTVLSLAQLLRKPTQTACADPREQVPYCGDQVGDSLHMALRQKQFWLTAGCFFCFGVFANSIPVHMTAHLISLGFSTATAANIFIAIGASSLISRIVIGSMCDRVSSRSALIACFIVAAVSFAWLLASSGLFMYIAFAAGFGFAFGGMATVQSPLIADLFGVKAHGAILGSCAFVVGLGAALGPLMLGSIFDITGSYFLGFWFLLAFAVAGTGMALLIKQRGERYGADPGNEWERMR